MKLLLTSTGFSSPKIFQGFLDLMNSDSLQKSGEIKIAFIPSAAVSEEEKVHVDFARQELISLGIKKENIIDFHLDHEFSYGEIKDMDAMYVCGGNTFYLLHAMRVSNFYPVLFQFLQNNKVYVGVSAGSIVVTPSIAVASVEPADPNEIGITDFTGLGLVNFEVSPHVPEVVSYKSAQQYATTTKNRVYAFDHHCALLVNGDEIRFVGDGQHRIYNE